MSALRYSQNAGAAELHESTARQSWFVPHAYAHCGGADPAGSTQRPSCMAALPQLSSGALAPELNTHAFPSTLIASHEIPCLGKHAVTAAPSTLVVTAAKENGSRAEFAPVFPHAPETWSCMQ